ncbi:hypothetical protein D9V34_09385 [Mycetocola lacteus]|uniref:Uncharacterized protein n=1 Tax=Mycetocola lacteus TaxID=76637 RepID=A0A3L7ANM8_9MICO|nr:hypothetical protein [Mycetocola lacteus]RLP82026.1 hypothetical protein D9V34_09385 [Mycetocola lacteus]
MANDRDLSELKGKMKRAAIDCWMADTGFYPHIGNSKIYAKWGWMLNFYNRPDENGRGGGDGNGVTASVEAEFDAIRRAIDALVDRWLDLPDGSECDDPLQRAKTTANTLGASGGPGSGESTGDISTANNTVHEVTINKLVGSFRAPFLDKYFTQFSTVQGELAAACMILQTNYGAEREMWPAARVDASKLCERALQAWIAQQEQESDVNATMALTTVSAVAGVVTSLATAGAETIASVTALSAIAGSATIAIQGISSDVDVRGGSYQEIFQSLTEGFEKLDSVLKSQEHALNKMLRDTLAMMYSDMSRFNLDAFVLGSYPISDGTMRMERSDTQIIVNNMKRIADSLTQAVSTLQNAPARNPTPRDGSLGSGSNGTHTAASELWNRASRCLALTTSEYERGTSLFQATVEDFFQADAEAARIVAEIMAAEALTERFDR